MRVAHIITRLVPGGADENTILTCNHQAINGHDVFLICGHIWAPSVRSKLHPNVKFLVVPRLVQAISPVSDILAFVHLFFLTKKLKLDIVHTHTSKAGILGRMAARLAHVPAIVHGVHILAFLNVSRMRRWTYIAAEYLCGSFTHLFIHVSTQMRDECLMRGIGRGARHVVAESGMNIDRFRHARPPIDAEDILVSPVASTEKIFVILSLGALEPRKGHKGFLPIFSRVTKKHPNILLLIAGEGPEKESIQNEVHSLGLGDHVRLLGFRDDPECLLAIANASIICSVREGLPRVAVQSALAGVPIVSTDLPGISAIVRHNETGFITPVGDPSAMEQPILRLIEDVDTRNRISEKLLAGDYAPWDSNKMALKIDEAYESLSVNLGD